MDGTTKSGVYIGPPVCGAPPNSPSLGGLGLLFVKRSGTCLVLLSVNTTSGGSSIGFLVCAATTIARWHIGTCWRYWPFYESARTFMPCLQSSSVRK